MQEISEITCIRAGRLLEQGLGFYIKPFIPRRWGEEASKHLGFGCMTGGPKKHTIQTPKLLEEV